MVITIAVNKRGVHLQDGLNGTGQMPLTQLFREPVDRVLVVRVIDYQIPAVSQHGKGLLKGHRLY